ncbi:hypothetical protein ACFO0N_02150 [Halobium salinum]|uniref:Exosortase/archaeosortase family protein n=1 Tax=Halobium salinum TaxID=1364940 RepID=A0ABD5P7B5_9EURY|nr:hypothetical protein [Halobium salinum]
MPGVLIPCHAAATANLPLLAALTLGGVGAVVVAGLGVAAWLQRGSRSYLLVALALSTLLARSGVAALTLGGVIPWESHHTLEHGLDVVMAALVIAAVYYARQVERGREAPR